MKYGYGQINFRWRVVAPLCDVQYCQFQLLRSGNFSPRAVGSANSMSLFSIHVRRVETHPVARSATPRALRCRNISGVGSVAAIGIHGQWLWIDREKNAVDVK